MNQIKFLFLIIFIINSVHVSAEGDEVKSKFNTEFNGLIEQQHVSVLAEKLFNVNTKNEHELLIKCVEDNQEADDSAKWVCILYPMVVGNQEVAPVAPPDTNDWILIIDFKTNTYQLKKLWQQP